MHKFEGIELAIVPKNQFSKNDICYYDERILKQQKDNFGLTLDYDEDRRGHIIKRIDETSNTLFAGLTLGSRVIEIGGLICYSVSGICLWNSLLYWILLVMFTVINLETDSLTLSCILDYFGNSNINITNKIIK